LKNHAAAAVISHAEPPKARSYTDKTRTDCVEPDPSGINLASSLLNEIRVLSHAVWPARPRSPNQNTNLTPVNYRLKHTPGPIPYKQKRLLVKAGAIDLLWQLGITASHTNFR
jgi:hypothetical protein